MQINERRDSNYCVEIICWLKREIETKI